MVTTVSQLVEETRRLVYGATRQSLNRLAGAVLAADTMLTLELDLNDAVRGSMLSIDDELIWVMDSNVASKQVTVIRGYLGTTAANHADEALVEVNPRFPRAYIKRSLQQEIDSWGTRLFKVTTANISFSSTTRIYDLGISNFISVIDANLTPYAGRTTRSNPYRWTVLRDLDVSEFPSGAAFEFLGAYPTTGIVRIKLAQEFDVSTWTDGTDVETLGIASSMCDIPPFGAAWRLMSTREVGRTNMQAQPEPRRSEEVPAGHMASVAAQLKKLRDDRIEEERWTLLNRYPLKGVA
jgi:hypothetical protein